MVPQARAGGPGEALRRPGAPSASRSSADYEMGVIIQQGFPAYFLIVQEYIEWARSQGIGVGPGRGSAAGCHRGVRHGHHRPGPAAQRPACSSASSRPSAWRCPISTSTSSRAAAKRSSTTSRTCTARTTCPRSSRSARCRPKTPCATAARVLDYPYSVGDRICKMIGDELGITIDKALDTNPDLKKAYETEEDVRRSSTPRSPSRATCAARACTRAPPSSAATPWRPRAHEARHQGRRHHHPVRRPLHARSGPVEDGLLWACAPWTCSPSPAATSRSAPARRSCPRRSPLDDEEAFCLMQSGNMDGLFQVEGALYVSLFKRRPPTARFSDVVASIALNRPGPLESGMVEDYVKAAKRPGRRALLRRAPAPHPGRDPRHHGLPGADHADLHGHVRLLRRQGRQAAQGHGQEEARRHAPAAGGLGRGRGGERLSRSRSPSRSGPTPRSSRSTPSTSRTRPPTPSW